MGDADSAASPASLWEMAGVAWADRSRLTELIPGGVYGPAGEYLDGVLR
ncbi:hypothetical protein [Streptomyces sp. RPT161]|nr:hypothetical protein [Streptomyces sp. RPT161]